MMIGLDLKNHFSLISATSVDQVCHDSLSSIGVTYFNYIKIYNDGSRELLTNNAPWIDHFYKNSLYKTAGVVDVEYLLPKGYFLWSELKTDDPAYSQGRESFNIDNGISFVAKTREATTLYIFASEKNNETINNFYVRNIDLFKRFILYFNDKGYSLLEKASKNKIHLPEQQIIINRKLNRIDLSEKNRQDFFRKTNIERFFILNQENNLYLTKREAECISHMIGGATAKQTAKILGISFRTVESHFHQAKEKLQCSTRDELINCLINANIYDVIVTNKYAKNNV